MYVSLYQLYRWENQGPELSDDLAFARQDQTKLCLIQRWNLNHCAVPPYKGTFLFFPLHLLACSLPSHFPKEEEASLFVAKWPVTSGLLYAHALVPFSQSLPQTTSFQTQSLTMGLTRACLCAQEWEKMRPVTAFGALQISWRTWMYAFTLHALTECLMCTRRCCPGPWMLHEEHNRHSPWTQGTDSYQ